MVKIDIQDKLKGTVGHVDYSRDGNAIPNKAHKKDRSIR